MPAEPQTIELQQLATTVAALTEALARSERRHAHFVRSLRWGGLILISALVGIGTLFADRAGLAVTQPGGIPEAATVVDALNRIDQKLAVFGTLGETLQRLTPAIGNAMGSNPEVRQAVDDKRPPETTPLKPPGTRATLQTTEQRVLRAGGNPLPAPGRTGMGPTWPRCALLARCE